MIKSESLDKKFGNFSALTGISFEIQKGEIVGFLGPNGAGKTTLMRILTTYLQPTSGRAIVAGYDVQSKPIKVRQRIGYLPETPPLYEYLTVKEYLRFAASVKGVPSVRRTIQVDKVMEQCWLKDVASRDIRVLSKGYKQRVGLAQAILHDPEVIILDEPTSGLDPIQNAAVRKLIKDLEHERTVIVSTHILSEIVSLANRVLIICDGKVVIDENLEKLLRTSEGSRRIHLRFRGDQVKMYQIIGGAGGPKVIQSHSQGDVHDVELEMPLAQTGYNEFLQGVIATGVEILSVNESACSLEEVFFNAIGDKESCSIK